MSMTSATIILSKEAIADELAFLLLDLIHSNRFTRENVHQTISNFSLENGCSLSCKVLNCLTSKVLSIPGTLDFAKIKLAISTTLP